MRISEPDPDNQPTRDDSQLELLRADMGEAADEVVAAYQDSISGEIQSLRASDQNTPSVDLKRHAHTIKSSSLAIGAVRLAHLAYRLEKAITDETQIDGAAMLVEIEAEFDRYLAC